MAIQLSPEEQKLFREGKLDINDLVKERKKSSPKPKLNQSDLDKVKQAIRETNLAYKESIQRNKDLYEELVENRKKKAELREKLQELRTQKKKLLGQ